MIGVSAISGKSGKIKEIHFIKISGKDHEKHGKPREIREKQGNYHNFVLIIARKGKQ